MANVINHKYDKHATQFRIKPSIDHLHIEKVNEHKVEDNPQKKKKKYGAGFECLNQKLIYFQ